MATVTRFCLLMTLLLSAVPIAAARYALLIGCNDGGSGVDALKYAEKDAESFAAILTRLGGFEQRAVTVLLHPDSTALEERLRTARKTVAAARTPDADLFLIYYSGHANGTDLMLGNGRYPLKKVRMFLDSIGCGVKIGVFDACQSGTVTAYKGGKRAEPFYLKNPQRVKGQIIITSTSASERAQESETLHGSIFSFYWFAGLRGSADASGDRRVTLSEAYNYAYRKTLETSTLTGGEAQHPMYRFNISGEGDIMLTDLAGRTGGIVFDKSTEGKFLVLSDSYTDIFADFFKKKNSEWYVSLDPGSYTAINANGGSVGMYSFAIGPGAESRVELAQSMLVPNAFTETRIKGANEVVKTTMSAPSTSPLTVWSFGFGLGGSSVIADGAKTGQSISLLFAGSRYITENAGLFFNVYYFTPRLNLGADVGFDFARKFSSAGIFGGAGAGLYYLEKNGPLFEDRLAPAATGHVGFSTDIGRSATFVFQIPYTMVFGPEMSNRIGVEVKFLFSGRYKDVKVLHY
jgi:hypothetical protein